MGSDVMVTHGERGIYLMGTTFSSGRHLFSSVGDMRGHIYSQPMVGVRVRTHFLDIKRARAAIGLDLVWWE